jgi:hypothetical protein
MRAMERNKNWITLTVLVTFLWLSYLASAPLPAASGDETMSPMAVEKDAPSKPLVKKKSILPYILIGVGVLAAAAALYFLVLKGDSEKIHDDFDDAADALWVPRTPTAWTVAGGYYICQKAQSAAPADWWEWSLYNRAWTKPNYTVTARMKVTDHLGYFGLLLTTDSTMTAANGYQFLFCSDGTFKIRRVEGWNYKTSTATSFSLIKDWTSSPAILPGVSVWNTYKLVKAGGDYKLYANDDLVHQFTDATYDPRLVAVAGHTQVQAVYLQIDSFYVDLD